jgi:Rrf2 family iron-sulfur cluster assembly transcriptional regulator
MAIVNRETDYAVRALLTIILEDGWVPVSGLSEAQDVPEDFLRKTMQKLHRAGIVESKQGPFGGYRLAGSAEDLTALDVLEAVQGPLVINECFSDEDTCDNTSFCPVRQQLAEIQIMINAELARINLADMARRLRALERAKA